MSSKSKEAKDDYTPPEDPVSTDVKKYANANIVYDIPSKSFYLEFGQMASASGDISDLRIPKDGGGFQTASYRYTGAETGRWIFPDTSISTFRFHFEIDPEIQDESSGMGVDAIKVLKEGGQGNYLFNAFAEKHTWNHSVGGGYRSDLEGRTAWKDTAGKSAKLKLLQ